MIPVLDICLFMPHPRHVLVFIRLFMPPTHVLVFTCLFMPPHVLVFIGLFMPPPPTCIGIHRFIYDPLTTVRYWWVSVTLSM